MKVAGAIGADSTRSDSAQVNLTPPPPWWRPIGGARVLIPRRHRPFPSILNRVRHNDAQTLPSQPFFPCDIIFHCFLFESFLYFNSSRGVRDRVADAAATVAAAVAMFPALSELKNKWTKSSWQNHLSYPRLCPFLHFLFEDSITKYDHSIGTRWIGHGSWYPTLYAHQCS